VSGRARAGLPLLLLAAAVLVVALVAGPGPDGLPLDPRSTAPDGTKALVDVLGELGARVRLTASPGQDADVALLLTDTLDEDARAALEQWTAAGGRLVVGDGQSPLTPEPVGGAALGGFVQAPVARDCEITALAAVGEVQPGNPSVVYDVPEGSTGCFARNDGSWLVVSGYGDGVVVALGGPEVLTNALLGSADHGLLAAALLAPEPGTRVAFLRPPRPGEGDASLADLLDPRVVAALWQLLVAFGVVVAWRARRLGRPLEEHQPVEIPGSELVVAVGNLLQQTRAAHRAASLLRADAHRFVAERLGLPSSIGAQRLAEVAAQRTGVEEGEARRVLAGPLPVDEDGLVELARAAERLRSALTSTGSRPGERMRR
jgi:hypothetical protein